MSFPEPGILMWRDGLCHLKCPLGSTHSASYRHTLFYCALLCCTSQISFPFSLSLFFFFYKLKICGNPALSKSMGGIFPTTSAHFLSLCHILVALTVFQTFSWVLVGHGDLRSVVSDVTAVMVLGSREPCPYKTVNFISKSVCSDSSTDWFFPLSCSLFSGLLILWELISENLLSTILASGQLITL